MNRCKSCVTNGGHSQEQSRPICRLSASLSARGSGAAFIILHCRWQMRRREHNCSLEITMNFRLHEAVVFVGGRDGQESTLLLSITGHASGGRAREFASALLATAAKQVALFLAINLVGAELAGADLFASSAAENRASERKAFQPSRKLGVMHRGGKASPAQGSSADKIKNTLGQAHRQGEENAQSKQRKI